MPGSLILLSPRSLCGQLDFCCSVVEGRLQVKHVPTAEKENVHMEMESGNPKK